MKIDHLALDIETVPARPLESYSETTRAAIERRIQRAAESDPDMTYEKFASLNADLGRVICISVGYVNDGTIRLKSYAGEDERAILVEFNRLLGEFSGTFIHYNGLGFDVPFILRRLAHHGMRPMNPRFANLRRFQYEPHLDLMLAYYHWDMRSCLPLGVLAETHGLPTPKGDLSGDKVYAAFLAGEWDRIRRYCEFDVATVLNLWRKVIQFVEPAACGLYEDVDVQRAEEVRTAGAEG